MTSDEPARAVDEIVLLRSLRRAGDENQLTRAIGDLAHGDQCFARGLLRALVAHAPRGQNVADRMDPSSPVLCDVERWLYSGNELKGRIELVIGNARLKLFVEVKLESDYRPDQLKDYLEAIDPAAGEFLISITRNISRFREPPPTEPGWLGAIRWARLAPALRDLPTRGALRDQWNLLLDVLRKDGDLGSIGVTAEQITAFEQSNGAYSRLSDFLEQIGASALHRVRAELSGGNAADHTAAAFKTTRRKRPQTGKRARTDLDEDRPEVIWDDDGGLYLGFNIPARGAERLWIGFYVDDDEKSFFYLAAGGPEDPEPWQEARWRDATKNLRDLFPDRRVFCNEDNGLYVQIDYPLSQFADAADVPAALATQIDDDVPRLARTGAFGADARPL